MENQNQRCSLEEHNEIDAKSYCPECKIYICNKCEKYHSNLFKKHHSFNLDINLKDLFTGFCKIKNHQNELDYFCKTHNLLCCAKCITKIKSKGNGQHTDCEICNIEEIVNEKKNNLKNNMKILENLWNSFQNSVDKLKILIEKLIQNKEEVKLNIQKILTNLRNSLNDREDELLLEVDKEFEKLYFNEEILKESQKLPEKIKISLEKGKILDKEWDNNKLNSLINDCVNIENDIKYMNLINEKIKNCSLLNFQIKFSIEGNEEKFLELIKKFGNIYNKETNKIYPDINININDFNSENIKCIKKISDYCGFGGNYYVHDGICFFISKKNEYVLDYIDSKSENNSIIFYDINNNNEIKKFNKAHNGRIHIIKYYNYFLYDIILSSSNNNDIKIWNYNESLNILTISTVFSKDSNVYSSTILFDNDSFYIFCLGESDYIKIYDSSGNFFKNISNNDESRRYIEAFEINEEKYIISGGNKGITVFNYPSFSKYNCFVEDKDITYHNYARIIKNNGIY